MHKRKTWIGALAFCLAVRLAGPVLAERGDDPVVARVGEAEITLAELKSYQGRFPQQSRGQVLDLLLAREVLRLAGQEQGLAADPEIADQLHQFEWQTLLQTIQDREIGAAQFGQAELEALYAEWGSGEEVRASHILCDTEAEAAAVLEQIRGGSAFETLARSRSGHKLSAQVGGEMGYMRKDMLMPEFREQVWTLPAGQVYPQPLRSRLGYHVVKATEHRKIGLDSLRGALVEELQARRRQTLRGQLAAAQRDTLHFAWDAEVARGLVGREHARPTRADSTTLVARWEGGELTVAEYLLRSRIYGVRNSLADTAAARRAGEQLTVDDLLVSAARRRGYDREAAFERKRRAKMAELFSARLFARQVDSLGAPADSLVRAYFAAHQDQFQLPPGVRVQEILLDDAARADSIKAALFAGADMAAIAASHTRRAWARGTGGDLGVLTPKTPGYGELLPLAFAAEPGQLQGPIHLGGFLVLFRVTERVPPRPATLEEARTGVVQRLQEEAMDRYIARLRQQYAEEIAVRTDLLAE